MTSLKICLVVGGRILPKNYPLGLKKLTILGALSQKMAEANRKLVKKEKSGNG